VALALLDAAFGVVVGAYSFNVFRARHREALSCLDLVFTSVYAPGTTARKSWTYGMFTVSALMALAALAAAVVEAR
jgi:hypothetical protein